MSSDPRDYTLDLSGSSPTPQPRPHSPAPRPFLSVLFRCCSVYARVHRSPDAAAYRGHCPRCALPVQFKVGAGGTDSRFFVVE